MRVVVAWVAVLAAGIASGEPQPWMKQQNPDDLGLVVRVGSACPATMQDYADLVRGILTRSRIGVADSRGTLLLYLDVQCADASVDDLHPFSVDVHFGRLGEDGLILFTSATYGQLGLANKGDIREAARDMTEAAITDYLKANFDL